MTTTMQIQNSNDWVKLLRLYSPLSTALAKYSLVEAEMDNSVASSRFFLNWDLESTVAYWMKLTPLHSEDREWWLRTLVSIVL